MIRKEKKSGGGLTVKAEGSLLYCFSLVAEALSDPSQTAAVVSSVSSKSLSHLSGVRACKCARPRERVCMHEREREREGGGGREGGRGRKRKRERERERGGENRNAHACACACVCA